MRLRSLIIEIRDPMFVLYPLDPLDRRRPDDVYAAEAVVCDGLGIGWTPIDHDALEAGAG